jgi:hypothetical protein
METLIVAVVTVVVDGNRGEQTGDLGAVQRSHGLLGALALSTVQCHGRTSTDLRYKKIQTPFHVKII